MFTKSKRAFTLIELLVVVLIIGILSAIALPQYQSAVLKTKYANLVLLTETYFKAAQSSYLATGEWPASFDVLDVSLPGGVTQNTTSTVKHCGEFKDYYCCVKARQENLQDPGITCAMQNKQLGYSMGATQTGTLTGRTCWAAIEDAAANRVCKGVGTYHCTGSGTGCNMSSPGSDVHMKNYAVN